MYSMHGKRHVGRGGAVGGTRRTLLGLAGCQPSFRLNEKLCLEGIRWRVIGWDT